MGRMRFDVTCVKQCLIANGKVFTVRSYCLPNANVYVDGVGICRRIRSFEVKQKSDLEQFVKLSGFSSVEEWWKKVCEFYGNKRKWLYLVKRLEKR